MPNGDVHVSRGVSNSEPTASEQSQVLREVAHGKDEPESDEECIQRVSASVGIPFFGDLIAGLVCALSKAIASAFGQAFAQIFAR